MHRGCRRQCGSLGGARPRLRGRHELQYGRGCIRPPQADRTQSNRQYARPTRAARSPEQMVPAFPASGSLRLGAGVALRRRSGHALLWQTSVQPSVGRLEMTTEN